MAKKTHKLVFQFLYRILLHIYNLELSIKVISVLSAFLQFFLSK